MAAEDCSEVACWLSEEESERPGRSGVRVVLSWMSGRRSRCLSMSERRGRAREEEEDARVMTAEG